MEHVIENVINGNNPGNLLLEKQEYVEDTKMIEGIYDNEVGVFHSCLYKPKEIEEDFPTGAGSIIHQDISYIVPRYGHRNTYINTESISNIEKDNSAADIGIDYSEYQKYFNRLRSGIHDETYKPHMVKYLETVATLEQLLDFSSYNKSNKMTADEFDKLFPSTIMTRYSASKIDKALVDALRNPEKNIEFLKSKLTLNKDIGFYVDKNGIPYLCLHEFMLFDNNSIKTMLEACADVNYCCKYCKSPLTYNLDAEGIDFTPIQYRVVYLFIEMLDMVSYEEFIGQIVIAAISQSINKLEMKYDDSLTLSEAFTATYVYKMFNYISDKMKLLSSDGFIKLVKHIWNKSGWDDEVVQTLISNEERFEGFTHCCDIILSFKESEHITMETIIDVLLKNIEGDGNPIQQLYLKDKTKIGKMVDLLINSANNYIQMLQLPMILKEDIDLQKVFIELFINTGKQIKPFYKLWWKQLCPVAGIHTFVKGTCKECGINEDNVEKIFDKYESKITAMLLPPSNKAPKQSCDTRSVILAGINQADIKKPEILNEILLTDSYIDKLRSKLEELIHIGKIEEIKNTKENCCKMLNYIISTSITAETISLELDALLVPAISITSKLITVF